MRAVVVRREDGGVELRHWPAWAVRVLDEMVFLCGPEIPDARARARLFPTATDDPEQAEEWRRNVHPELFALLASAQDVVLRDMGSSVRGRKGGIRKLVIPAGHLPAWIAAINAARLHLGSTHGVDAAVMQKPWDELSDDLRPVVVRIDMLAELQVHLIQGVEPAEGPAPGGDRPENAGAEGDADGDAEGDPEHDAEDDASREP